VYLYRVHLYLTYNVHTNPLDVGEVLMGLPFPPVAGEFYWNTYYAHYFAAHLRWFAETVYPTYIPVYMKCVINNTHALHSILSLPAMRPAQLTAILPQLSYTCPPIFSRLNAAACQAS
jgi:hypothetical protein